MPTKCLAARLTFGIPRAWRIFIRSGSFYGMDMPESVDVLHVVPAYFPARGGIEVLVENLCDGLLSSHGLTSAVLVSTPAPAQPATFIHRGVAVYSVEAHVHQGFDLGGDSHNRGLAAKDQLAAIAKIFSQVRSVIKACKPRIVHVHTSSSLTSAVIRTCDSTNIPMLFHMHGMIHEGNGPNFRSRLHDAPWVCAVSNAVAQSIRDECGRNAPIAVIRNGVVDPYPSTLPYRPISPSVAMVGRLWPEKGFDDGLQALKMLREQIPELVIRLVGTGPQEENLYRLCQNLGLLNSINFFGQLSNDDALRIVAGVDVILVPSRSVEGFSLSAVEAAMLRKPVVATAVGGLPETVLHGTTGVVVAAGDTSAMADALLSLLTDAKRRSQMGERARERALQTFDQRRFVEEIANLYSQITISKG
jgi:glycosyltransferase involved in cell wall biosynthesis